MKHVVFVCLGCLIQRDTRVLCGVPLRFLSCCCKAILIFPPAHRSLFCVTFSFMLSLSTSAQVCQVPPLKRQAGHKPEAWKCPVKVMAASERCYGS